MISKENNYAFIDSNNLNLGVQSMGWKLDFAKFRRYLREKYGVTTAYLFIGYIPTNQGLYSSLQKDGYVLIFKPVIPDQNGKLQVMIDYEKYDNAVIVSSDGDFYSLVKYLYENNKLKFVMSPYIKTCSALLKKSAKEKIIFMENSKEKLEYRDARSK